MSEREICLIWRSYSNHKTLDCLNFFLWKIEDATVLSQIWHRPSLWDQTLCVSIKVTNKGHVANFSIFLSFRHHCCFELMDRRGDCHKHNIEGTNSWNNMILQKTIILYHGNGSPSLLDCISCSKAGVSWVTNPFIVAHFWYPYFKLAFDHFNGSNRKADHTSFNLTTVLLQMYTLKTKHRPCNSTSLKSSWIQVICSEEPLITLIVVTRK